jgi:hypothetical protein
MTSLWLAAALIGADLAGAAALLIRSGRRLAGRVGARRQRRRWEIDLAAAHAAAAHADELIERADAALDQVAGRCLACGGAYRFETRAGQADAYQLHLSFECPARIHAEEAQ